MMRRFVVGAVAAMRLVLLMLFLLLVFFLVTEHICSDRTGYQASKSPESATSQFVSKESTSSASDQSGT